MLAKNRWTILSAVLCLCLIFLTYLNVLSFRNRLVTVSKMEWPVVLDKETVIPETEPNPVQEPLPDPEPKPEPIQHEPLETHTVTFDLPDTLTVDQMQNLDRGPIATAVSKVIVYEGTDLYFTINLDKSMKLISVKRGGEGIEPATERIRPVYVLRDIREDVTVTVEAEVIQEQAPAVTPTPAPTAAPSPAPAPAPTPTYTFTHNVVQPTCTAQGYTDHICNEDRSRNYRDAYTGPLGHNYSGGKCTRCGAKDPNYKPPETWRTNVVPPTCTSGGYTEHICNENSSKNYTDNPVPALGHQYVDGVCSRCGHKQ